MLKLWRYILHKLGFRPFTSPEDLDSETLARAMKEARFLHSHRVDVSAMSRGEVPIPKRADDGDH